MTPIEKYNACYQVWQFDVCNLCTNVVVSGAILLNFNLFVINKEKDKTI